MNLELEKRFKRSIEIVVRDVIYKHLRTKSKEKFCRKFQKVFTKMVLTSLNNEDTRKMLLPAL